MNVSRAYLVLLAAVTLWCLCIVVPPLTAATGGAPVVSAAAERIGAAVCHQLPARTLRLGGVPLAVCARCTGIYTGFALAVLLAGVVAMRPLRRARAAWLVALAPMLLDVALDISGIRAATLASRLFSGVFFGVGAGLLLVPPFLEGLRELSQRFRLFTFRASNELHAE